VLAAEDWQEAYRDRLRHVVQPTGWREAADSLGEQASIRRRSHGEQ
jgi:hypothetical protein